MKVKFVRYSVCECGFPVLKESIPLGTEYEVDPKRLEPCYLICGGCRRRIKIIGIWVEHSDKGQAGFLPREIFDLPA